MSCYFTVDTYIDENGNISEYEEYIELVKPIVESYGKSIWLAPTRYRNYPINEIPIE